MEKNESVEYNINFLPLINEIKESADVYKYAIEFKSSSKAPWRELHNHQIWPHDDTDKSIKKSFFKMAKTFKKQEKWHAFRIIKNGKPIKEIK